MHTKLDRRAITNLFTENTDLIRAALYKFTHNAADVDELSQDVYLNMLAAGVMPASVRSPRAFCLTIARNVALDWWRHRKIVPIELIADMAELELVDENAQAEDIVNSHQELVVLADVVESMPPAMRRVFTLRKVYGYTQKEIAAALNISEHTVEQHLFKAARVLAYGLLGFEREFKQPRKPPR